MSRDLLRARRLTMSKGRKKQVREKQGLSKNARKRMAAEARDAGATGMGSDTDDSTMGTFTEEDMSEQQTLTEQKDDTASDPLSSKRVALDNTDPEEKTQGKVEDDVLIAAASDDASTAPASDDASTAQDLLSIPLDAETALRQQAPEPALDAAPTAQGQKADTGDELDARKSTAETDETARQRLTVLRALLKECDNRPPWWKRPFVSDQASSTPEEIQNCRDRTKSEIQGLEQQLGHSSSMSTPTKIALGASAAVVAAAAAERYRRAQAEADRLKAEADRLEAAQASQSNKSRFSRR